MDQPTASDLANLQREVSRLALAAGDLSASQKVFGARLEVAVRSVRRQQRIVAVLVIVALVGLALAVGVGVALHRQSCVNDRSNQFFGAEHDKVSGQVAGWEAQLAGERGKTAALGAMIAATASRPEERRAFEQYIADEKKTADGLQHAIDRSRHYLDVIATLPKC